MSKSTPSLMARSGLVLSRGIKTVTSCARCRPAPGTMPPRRPSRDPVPTKGRAACWPQHSITGPPRGGALPGDWKAHDMFRCTGQETAAESRVDVDRENESIGPEDLERAIRPEMVAELRQKTGLSRSEILSRLAATLPQLQNAASCGAALCVMSQRLAAPVAPCAHRLERDADMGIAIGFASLRGKAAEPEVVRRRIANRPFAGAFGQFHQA